VYSLGLGIPFFISSLAMHQFIVAFQRFKKYIRLFEVCTGVFLILIGVTIYFNWLSRFSTVMSTLFGGS
jgi:cytochrome c-type biogenesis protein